MHDPDLPRWRRRVPEDSVLWQVLAEHLEGFLLGIQTEHSGLPGSSPTPT